MSNTLVWVLAFSPALFVIIEGLFLRTANGAGTLIAVLVNTALAIADERRLNRAGHHVQGGVLLAALLIPVYLFVRAKSLRQSPIYAWVWVAVFVLSLTPLGSSALGGSSAVTIDADLAESEITSYLRDREVYATVSCPEGVPAEAGEIFICDVTDRGETAHARVEVLNDQGAFEWVITG